MANLDGGHRRKGVRGSAQSGGRRSPGAIGCADSGRPTVGEWAGSGDPRTALLRRAPITHTAEDEFLARKDSLLPGDRIPLAGIDALSKSSSCGLFQLAG